MREIVLPAGIEPGSPEAVAIIEAQLPVRAPEEPVIPDLVVGAAIPAVPASVYDLIIDGLEMMLDGFKELQDA